MTAKSGKKARRRPRAGFQVLTCEGKAVGLYFRSDRRIVPPIIRCGGDVLQGINLLAAIASLPHDHGGVPMIVLELTEKSRDAEVARIEQVLAGIAQTLGAEIDWDWANEPSESAQARRLLGGR